MTGTTLVIGVGHRYRSDDGIGPWVVDRLAERGIEAVEMSGEGASLIEAWQGQEDVILVDATQSGIEPGALQEFEAVSQILPAGLFRYSTHLFGVAEAIETARALGKLPRRLHVYGIEGANFAFGTDITLEVERTGAKVVEKIAAALTP